MRDRRTLENVKANQAAVRVNRLLMNGVADRRHTTCLIKSSIRETFLRDHH